jgi:hypothetical protein
MTPFVPLMPIYDPVEQVQSAGMTTSAKTIAELVLKVNEELRAPASDWRTLARDEIEVIAIENREPGWNGFNARPVSQASKIYAQRFVELLPSGLPPAEPMPDPEGEVALCWDLGPSRILTVAFSSEGLLNFAGLLGRGVERHGVEKFKGKIPPVILVTIQDLADS